MTQWGKISHTGMYGSTHRQIWLLKAPLILLYWVSVSVRDFEAKATEACHSKTTQDLLAGKCLNCHREISVKGLKWQVLSLGMHGFECWKPHWYLHPNRMFCHMRQVGDKCLLKVYYCQEWLEWLDVFVDSISVIPWIFIGSGFMPLLLSMVPKKVIYGSLLWHLILLETQAIITSHMNENAQFHFILWSFMPLTHKSSWVHITSGYCLTIWSILIWKIPGISWSWTPCTEISSIRGVW